MSLRGPARLWASSRANKPLPVLVRLLSHEDRWLRFKAAEAIKKMGGEAKPAISDILKAVVETAEPLQPIHWADSIQLAHGQLAAALFESGLTQSAQGGRSGAAVPGDPGHRHERGRNGANAFERLF